MNAMQKGFTLVELMMVVAIIGVLAAVAIPAYGDYTARAQAAEAFTLMDTLRVPLTERYGSSGEFYFNTGNPASDVMGTGFGKYVQTMRTGTTAAFSLVATFRTTNVSQRLLASAGTGASVHMYFNPNSGAWSCANGDDANDDATPLGSVASGTPALNQAAVPGNNKLAREILLPKSCLF